MSNVKIFWDPKGSELDALGMKKYLRATDGDTPYGNKRRSDRGN